MNNINRKKKLARFSFILGGLLLLMNGIVSINETKLTFGIIQIFSSMLNFGMLLNIKLISVKQKTEDLILVMNSIIASIIAFEYLKSGGKYIQYAWLLTSIIYLVVLFIKKRKTMPNNGYK
ncbi:MAG: hypothetical protein Wins2KO_13300 [Winogradskyella sp.]